MYTIYNQTSWITTDIWFPNLILPAAPPEIHNFSNQHLQYPNGSDVKIFCHGKGSPEPRVTWKKDGRGIQDFPRYQLSQDKTEVTIRNVSHSDGGEFKCIFENDSGYIEQPIKLIVQGERSDVLFIEPEVWRHDNRMAINKLQNGRPCYLIWKRRHTK